MLNWFKKKKKASAEVPPKWNFQQIDFSEVGDYTDGIQSIRSGDRAGFVVRNFASPEECERLIQGFMDVPDKVDANKGFKSYPMTFSQTEHMIQQGKLDPAEYYRQAEDFRLHFPERFGVDMEGRLRHVIQTLGNQMEVVPAPAPEGAGSLVPFTFRHLWPGEGGIKVHCGLLFYRDFPQLYERIRHFTHNDHQISFFLLLQAPESGGELTIYDLTWTQAKGFINDWTFQTEEGEHISIHDEERLPRQTLRPDAGSLIVFFGGEIWHQVEIVQGNRPRITLGGFLSFSEDLSRLHYWS